jgi:hypothetical protein
MGKVFTTSFQYDGRSYSAIVCLTASEDRALILDIQIPDRSLHYLVPGGKIRVMGYEEFQELLQDKSDHSRKLVRCVLDTVAKHLNSSNPLPNEELGIRD